MIQGNYEYETGFQILNWFKENNLSYEEVEMILVSNNAPFTWGTTAAAAVEAAVALECIAHLAMMSLQLEPKLKAIKPALRARHFQRKHGATACYGQRPGP